MALPAAPSTARRGALVYEAHRARAFKLAGRGDCDAALAELNGGWGDEWPDPASYAADVARIRLLVNQPAEALEALQLAVRGATKLEPRVPALAEECVRRSPSAWRQALQLAAQGGTPLDRARIVVAVARAKLS